MGISSVVSRNFFYTQSACSHARQTDRDPNELFMWKITLLDDNGSHKPSYSAGVNLDRVSTF